MKPSELSGVVIFELVWIGFWFLIGVSFIAWLGVFALIVTLLGMAFSND
tara:strand:- start:258 stop:404 length:147 start_codon:yes stop_codon:yes gene_type:complete